MTQSTKVAAFLETLKTRVTGPVRADDYSRTLYSTDASMYQVMPYGVLIPETIEDIESGILAHGRRRSLEQLEGIFLGKAHQKLAHPNRIETLRKRL